MAEIQLSGTSFASESSGTITVNNVTLSSSAVFPAGHIIQTVQHVETGVPSITTVSTNTFASFSTPFKKSITPIKTNSKIFVIVTINIGNDNGHAHFQLFRDGSVITGAIGGASETRLQTTITFRYNATPYAFGINNQNFHFLDAPTISDPPTAIEYEIKGTCGASYSEELHLNKNQNDPNNDLGARTASMLTLMEIAG